MTHNLHIQEQTPETDRESLHIPYDSEKDKHELSAFKTCLEKGHYLNKVENWVNGHHSHGVVQCGVCGQKCRYDYTFPVDPNYNVQKIYKVKHNGPWKTVHYDDLVFEFEDNEQENDAPIQQRKELTLMGKLKSLF